MTQEEKQLLLTDISARLSYGIKGKLFLFGSDKHTKEINIIGFTKLKGKLLERIFAEDELDYNIEWFKPYLRSMPSMTEEEKEEIQLLKLDLEASSTDVVPKLSRIMFWYYKHHFDVNGLIPMGLALEAPEGMY